MFENQSYEVIMQRTLSRVPEIMDKREGSIIFDALSPACAEIAQMYIELDNILKLTFAETSYGEWLDMRVREMGVHRRPATNAIRLGIMQGSNNTLIDIPIGTRFTIETLNYVAIERLSQGSYKLQCEQVGAVGNQLFGRLIPVDNVRNLVRGELREIIVPGEDTETDESLYRRYEERVNTSSFGGNIADYKEKVRGIEGVGGCKIKPVWDGGGTVKVVIIDSTYSMPSNILIDKIQQTLDPIPFGGEGKGIAPIGHLVTVEGVKEIDINIEANLVLSINLSLGQVKEEVELAIEKYLYELRQDWEHSDNIVIRVAQLISNIISIQGIEDVKNIMINGNESNVTLKSNEVPTKGEIILYE